MATILFAWELGESLGHVSNLLPLALDLKSRGHEPVFAVRDTYSAELLLSKHSISFVQAPLTIYSRNTGGQFALNYSEVLLNCGYHDEIVLAGLVGAWRNLFRLLRPEVIVFDHSPTAILASAQLDTFRVFCGNGFFLPPPVSPFPALKRHAQDKINELNKTDHLVLENINKALSRNDLPSLKSLTSIVEFDAQFLTTFRELDHYSGRSGVEYWGGIFLTNAGVSVEWANNEKKKIFVYLRPSSRGFERILSQLRTIDCDVVFYSPGISEEMISRYRSVNIRFSSNLIDLASLRNNCDLAIMCGGLGTLSACLLSGIPLLLLPQHLEQSIISERVADIGAGLKVDSPGPDFNFAEIIREMLINPQYKNSAGLFAKKYRDFSPDLEAKKMADAVIELMCASTQAVK